MKWVESEEWRQQDEEMDEAQLLVIFKVDERAFFWNVVCMSAGFCDQIAQRECPGLDPCVPMIRELRLLVSRDTRNVHHLKEKAGGPVCLTWF